MKRIFATAYLAFLSLLLSGQDLGKSMKDDAGNLWAMSPEKFMAAFASPKSYTWRSALKKNLIYNPDIQKTKLFFMGRPVIRASFRFNSNEFQGMFLTLAPADTLANHEAYLKQIEDLESLIKEIGRFGAPKVVSHDSGDKHRSTHSWQSPEYYIALRFSYNEIPGKTFVPGEIVLSVFHRFSFKSGSCSKSVSKPQPEKADEKADGKTNPDSEPEMEAKAKENGDHYLEVPMVKERSPQDCVAACMRRIFAYYKTAPRDRSWKKINKTLTMNEKSARGLKNASSTIAAECRCKVEKIADVSIFDNFNSLKDFMHDYNRQARKMKKNKINSFSVTSFEKLIQVIDEDVLITVRNKPEKIAAFKTRICKEIDAEKPVLWIVFTGVVKEKPELTTIGGRARLITGYNDKSNEVIYSDNLGDEHGQKKIAWEKAWAMTLTALAIHPNK